MISTAANISGGLCSSCFLNLSSWPWTLVRFHDQYGCPTYQDEMILCLFCICIYPVGCRLLFQEMHDRYGC